MTRRALPADPASVTVVTVTLGALVLVLTGCAGITNLLQKQHEESYATYAEAEKGWVGVPIPAWIPEDATELRNLATNDEQVSVVRISTPSQPLGDCAPEARHGIPALSAEWSTEEWPDTVMVCDDYELMPYQDGWLGWFNASEPGDVPG